MFKSFYSLAKEPFSKDIRPSDAFLSSDYQKLYCLILFTEIKKLDYHW